MANYPTGTDLSAFLVASALFADPPTKAQQMMDLDGAMLAAVAEFERLTRYTPFLSDGTVKPRTFNGPGSDRLPLAGGLLSLSSLTINTTPYTLNQQFVLGEPDAPDRGLPYTYVDFGSGWNSGYEGYGAWDIGSTSLIGLGTLGNGRRSIVVTGVWGYSLTLPFDVKRALLRRGASMLAPDLTHVVTRGQSSIRLGTDTFSYAASTFGQQMQAWGADFAATVARYTLPPSFGL